MGAADQSGQSINSIFGDMSPSLSRDGSRFILFLSS